MAPSDNNCMHSKCSCPLSSRLISETRFISLLQQFNSPFEPFFTNSLTRRCSSFRRSSSTSSRQNSAFRNAPALMAKSYGESRASETRASGCPSLSVLKLKRSSAEQLRWGWRRRKLVSFTSVSLSPSRTFSANRHFLWCEALVGELLGSCQ